MTTPYFFIEEHRILSALFDEGLDVLHMRKPDSEVVYSERLLTLLPTTYRKKVMIHDHFYLKKEYGLRGLHINPRSAATDKKYSGSMSCTLGNIEEVEAMKKMFDYMFLGPLYNSNLPENQKGSLIDKENLVKGARSGAIDRKVMAMGNVTLDNVAELRDLNFGGVVILGDIWNKFNIHSTQDFKELIEHFKRLRKAVD